MNATLPPEFLAAASQVIETRMGLHFPPERWSDLERGLQAAAVQTGAESMESFARDLSRAALSDKHLAALAEQLTVGETYFFRDPAAFSLLPALAQEQRARGRRLRIWSAGCCTGEEPYSIAIALCQAIPDLADWHVTILATDINAQFLRKATAGVYGAWSFRGVPDATRRAWFRETAPARFEVVPRIRQMVTFAALNLSEDVYPALATNSNAMDLIFCRNLLMYFSRERVRQVLAGLHRALVPGGRLLVSATEASQELFTEFTSEGIPGLALYRKKAPAPPAPAVPIFANPPPASAPAIPPADEAADARRLADGGDFTAALAACDRALAADRLVPALHYLRGVILQEQSALEAAATAFRRALFLDPAFVLAHFTLGHLLLRQSRDAEARRCFANAHALLRSHAPAAVLPESDGLTAARLLAILTSMEEALA